MVLIVFYLNPMFPGIASKFIVTHTSFMNFNEKDDISRCWIDAMG